MKDTLSLESSSAHIAIEWIINEKPRRYGLTAVTLFLVEKAVRSYRYTYEYEEGDKHRIENLPSVRPSAEGKVRPADREEMNDYYTTMKSSHPLKASTFETVKSYHQYLEERFKIIASEWKKIAVINSSEGGVESFFDGCKTTSQLVDQLLIPTVKKKQSLEKGLQILSRLLRNNASILKHINGYDVSLKKTNKLRNRLKGTLLRWSNN